MKRPWVSAVFKEPVEGKRWLGSTNVEGDCQADLENHGGPDKAVLLYAAAHYPLWRSELGDPALPYGAFGENFTIDGLTEEIVCIGDVFAVGQARIQVSQPRQPCWKIERRWNRPGLTRQVQRTGRTGWYARVLDEGAVEAGLSIELLERPHPEWTVARASATIPRRRVDPATAADLASLPPLSEAWKQTLAGR